MVTKTIEQTQTYCDVCGDKTDNEWWECHTRNGFTVAEFYAPIDLCAEHIHLFDAVSKKYRQERYERYELTNEYKLIIINDMLKVE